MGNLTLQQRYTKALEARGWVVAKRLSRHIVMERPGDDQVRYFIGRNGALRMGRTLSESKPRPEHFKRDLAAEYTRDQSVYRAETVIKAQIRDAIFRWERDPVHTPEGLRLWYCPAVGRQPCGTLALMKDRPRNPRFKAAHKLPIPHWETRNQLINWLYDVAKRLPILNTEHVYQV